MDDAAGPGDTAMRASADAGVAGHRRPSMPTGLPSAAATVGDVTAMISLYGDGFQRSLADAREAIIGEIRLNAQAGQQRWEAHDKDHHLLQSRLEELVATLEEHVRESDRLHGVQHDREVAVQARLGPLRGVYVFLLREWRWLLVAAALAADWFISTVHSLTQQ